MDRKIIQFILCDPAGEIIRDNAGAELVSMYTTEPGNVGTQFPAGSKWIPLRTDGASPFDPSWPYRGEPVYERKGDYVLRTYPALSEFHGRA